jgi:hypothetical protein
MTSYGRPGIRVGAVIAVAAVAGFLVWYLVIRSDDGNEAANVKAGSGPVAASESDLATLSDKLGQPIYWAGPQPDTQLELTRTTTGRIYVRYLSPGAKIGDRKAGFLTVGTYPFENAYQALQKAADRPGAKVGHIDNGGLVVTNRSSRNSVYLAYRDESFQVETYDPDPARALSLVTAGDVRPVD